MKADAPVRGVAPHCFCDSKECLNVMSGGQRIQGKTEKPPPGIRSIPHPNGNSGGPGKESGFKGFLKEQRQIESLPPEEMNQSKPSKQSPMRVFVIIFDQPIVVGTGTKRV